LKKKLLKLLRKVEEEDEGYLFADPVTDDIAPGYSKIIREPMDFQKINSKFQNRMYENIDQLRDDMYKMFDNCEQYNEPDSCFVVEAHRLRDIVDETLAAINAGTI
jgi:bromodomain-containing protein 7/9